MSCVIILCYNCRALKVTREAGKWSIISLSTGLPTTTEGAQFNFAWPLTAYIIGGEIGPDQILEHALKHEDIRDVATRIEVEETEQLNELHRLASEGDPDGKFVSKVFIQLRDGRELETDQIEGKINFPQNAWDDESLEEKFRSLTRHVLEEDNIDAVVQTILGSEELPDVRELTSMLA